MTDDFPPLTRQHVLNCAFSAWHARYRKLVPRATVIKPVDEGFVQYLLADGIVLPPDRPTADWSEDDQEPDTDQDADSGDHDPAQLFPHVHARVREVLDEYGAVTPKLNWSAPRDATWISATNTLKCVTPGDVYLLLKASSFVMHDLLHPFDPAEPDAPLDAAAVELVLRKHVEFNPALEFRAFVRAREIVGISQRADGYYDFLAPSRETLDGLIVEFYDTHLRDSFPDDNFCFDVYIPRPDARRVWLVDINPFAPTTDPLLYAWPELLAVPAPHPHELRLVPEHGSVHAFSAKPFSAHMVPRDVVDASVQGGEGIAAFAKQWKDILDSHSH